MLAGRAAWVGLDLGFVIKSQAKVNKLSFLFLERQVSSAIGLPVVKDFLRKA